MIDFGQTNRDYAQYRTDFAPQLFERLAAMGIGLAGQRILDIGAGTGLLAKALQQRGCEVTLLDRSEPLLRRACNRIRVVAQAERLPLADGSFDIISASQCWHWFDRTRTPEEIMRVLKPAGALAVIYQTYIPLPGSVAEATEELILKFNPGWRHANSTGINGQVLRDVQPAGFEQIESFSFDISVQFSRDAWRGFIRTTSPVGASMKQIQIDQFDAEHCRLLDRQPETLFIPHRVFVVIARKPASRI